MTLFLDNNDISKVLDIKLTMNVLERAYNDFIRGDAVCMPRSDFQIPTSDSAHTYQFGITVGGGIGRYMGLRLKSDITFPEHINGQTRKGKYCVEPGKYCGLILLFDVETGALLAIMNDGLIQQMRVGADSGLGVKWMARPGSSIVGMLGSGGMARTHIDAFMHVRPISQIKVYSPTKENRERFALEIAAKHNVEVVDVDCPDDVYQDADIISGCASISGPIINGDLLQPGTHITCIGGTLDAAANTAIDVALRFGSARPPLEAPEMNIDSECLTFAAGPRTKTSFGGTKKFSDIDSAKQISLEELLADPSRGRTKKNQITFSERGNLHGLQFYSVAGAVYESALTRGLGLKLPGDDFLQTIRN